MKNTTISIIVFVVGALIALAVFLLIGGTDDTTEETNTTNTSEQEGSQGTSEEQTGEVLFEKQPDSVTYKVFFETLWSSDVHTLIPEGAHFSPVVVWTHTKDTSVFEVGKVASAGIQLMAETGDPSVLRQELETLQSEGMVGEYVIGELLYSPNSLERELVVTQDHRYVSLVSMIAPSPDWFVAVRDVDVFPDRQWVEYKNETAVYLSVYDAGTDSGEEFTSQDTVTEPRGVVHSLMDDGIVLDSEGGPLARVSFTQK